MEQESTSPPFTVLSSASALRDAARAGDLATAEHIIARYNRSQTELHKLLPAVLTAVDRQSGNSALHLCCANGHLQLVQRLLQLHNNVNQKNASGSTPLHYACVTGQLDVVRVLLRFGALPVVENRYGKTPLDDAYSGSHQQVVDFLIQHVQDNASAPHATEGDQQQQQPPS